MKLPYKLHKIMSDWHLQMKRINNQNSAISPPKNRPLDAKGVFSYKF